MKQTIEIEVPDGKKAVWKDNKVVFEDIKPQLPKTWKEYVTFHFPVDKFPENHYACAKTSLFSCHTTNSDYESVLQTKNILTSDKTIKQHLALMQLHQLRDCYRQGWEPDWNDNYDKYIIIKNKYIEYVIFIKVKNRYYTYDKEDKGKYIILKGNIMEVKI